MPAGTKAAVLKVAIVGCGKIADAHAMQIRRIKDCAIVGVCDREPLMARQLADRFPVQECFNNVTDLLNQARPDVVHITTPPQGHFDIARECLEGGCHVYVEKPFTLDYAEARRLIALARERRLKITVGHDDQFSHVARRMRALVGSGYLGGAPVHMESYYVYELGGSYVAALMGDKHHWVRRLPGKLLHNIISHGIARIAEFMTSDSPEVIAYGFTSPYLKNMGETEIVDELRVIVSEESGMTAYFTFSSQMRPDIHQFRVYGPQNGLIVDQDQETLIKLSGARSVSYLEKFVPPVVSAKQQLGNLATNLRTFLARDFHMKAGMKFLIESFYRAIREGAADPISHREILLTAKIMDAIFQQINSRAARREQRETIAL
ncbi:MAG TPA: Gfo/Idh/MocA family oxidoreductase [Bryobacteraceae bacterium]|nr:Gfo/Idh/MocA family oxidoreductase [Bryobacteraceae bacterium]